MKRIVTRMYLTGFTGGPCPGCGYVGELLEVHNDVDTGTRIIIHGGLNPGGTVSCRMPLKGLLITAPDGTWSYDPDWVNEPPMGKPEKVDLIERGISLPTNNQWVDVPGSPFQVMTQDKDALGTFWLRTNPNIRPDMLNHWSCWQ